MQIDPGNQAEETKNAPSTEPAPEVAATEPATEDEGGEETAAE